MRDSLTFDNAEDFRARYEHCYGYLILPEKADKLLVYLISINPNRVDFKDILGRELFIKSNTGVQFEFIPVDRGWVCTAKDTYYMARVPARQWKRGINPNNTLVWKFADMAWNGNFENVKGEIFNVLDGKTDEHLQLSFFDWKYKKRKTCALSKHFAINSNSKLFFYDQPIGEYREDSLCINTPIIQQELQDLINRRGLELGVILE